MPFSYHRPVKSLLLSQGLAHKQPVSLIPIHHWGSCNDLVQQVSSLVGHVQPDELWCTHCRYIVKARPENAVSIRTEVCPFLPCLSKRRSS